MNLEPSENISIYGYKYFFNEITELINWLCVNSLLAS